LLLCVSALAAVVALQAGCSRRPIFIAPHTKEVIRHLSPFQRNLQEKLAASPSPNLVKSHDIGEPTDYHADYAWHSLRKERVNFLPFTGCLGMINPNTELYYLIGIGEGGERPAYRLKGKTILHGIDYLCEEANIGEGLKAYVTFMPFSSDTLMAFVELCNSGESTRHIRVSQTIAKEVFTYDPRLKKMPCRMRGVYVATRGMDRVEELGDGAAVQFEEWEGFGKRGDEVHLGELIAFAGADRRPDDTRVSRPGPEAAHMNPGPYEPSRMQSYERGYDTSVPPGGTARLTTFISLRRYKSDHPMLYPRLVTPFLHGTFQDALEYCRNKIGEVQKVNWRKRLTRCIEAYDNYPDPDLPIKSWEADFLACLQLPRAETCSPQHKMPVPFYNFCRAFGNEIRHWWSYGEHGHESLSTFVTAMTDPALAADHLRGHFVNQEEDGSFPYGVNMFSEPGIRTFAVSAATCPFIAWEAWNTYLWSGDRKFLEEAYDRCSRSYRYWMRTRDRTGEGLVCWIGFGETVRDDGDLETWRYKGAPIFFQEALDLNCYLLNMENVLAEMAAESGDVEKEKLYRDAWKKRARAMNAYMWNRKDHCYYGTSEVSSAMARVKDISVLMPLWCGVAPLDRAGHVRKLLLDKKHFASTWPIPSLSMAERSYNPGGHWHGSSWIEISDLIILGLKDYGYYSDAAKLAYLTTRMAFEELERCSHFREYFNPETGEGIGLFDYIWGCMPAHLIIDVFYGLRPNGEGIDILPALPDDWKRIAISNLHIRDKVLDLEIVRTAETTETEASVNGERWSEIIDGRGITVPWSYLSALPGNKATIRIVQPLEIEDTPHLPSPLPEDVLEPIGPHERVEPTEEEIEFNSRFLHYVVEPKPYKPAPTRKPLHFPDGS